MKRSFSEFRTQRELGAKDLPKIMSKCKDALIKMNKQAKVGAHMFCFGEYVVCCSISF